MHSAVETMLKKYNIKTNEDKKKALKEIVQEIALLGLYRSGFFNHAAFYGGTCLRIFYGLDRFSENLDFSLIKVDTNFEIKKYTGYVRNELEAFGFEMQIEEKIKKAKSNIKSAFIKGKTKTHLIKITRGKTKINGIHSNEKIKIKLEVDVNPPGGANIETNYHLNPVPFSVRTYTLDSLFAGKIHALLCRSLKSRVKGRDFYDYVWYLSQGASLSLRHLQERLKQSNDLDPDLMLNLKLLKDVLISRFEEIDFEQAKQDVLPFISGNHDLNVWSEEFFKAITQNKLKVYNAPQN